MTDTPLLYNGPTSPFGRKCKVSALVLDVAHKEEKINIYNLGTNEYCEVIQSIAVSYTHLTLPTTLTV